MVLLPSLTPARIIQQHNLEHPKFFSKENIAKLNITDLPCAYGVSGAGVDVPGGIARRDQSRPHWGFHALGEALPVPGRPFPSSLTTYFICCLRNIRCKAQPGDEAHGVGSEALKGWISQSTEIKRALTSGSELPTGHGMCSQS